MPTADSFTEIRHELKTPLTTIRLYTEALLHESTDSLTDEQREYIQEIAKASTTMLASVDKLRPENF